MAGLETHHGAEFKRLAALLFEHPQIDSPRSKGRRGLSMSVLPYTVIYRCASSARIAASVRSYSPSPKCLY